MEARIRVREREWGVIQKPLPRVRIELTTFRLLVLSVIMRLTRCLLRYRGIQAKCGGDTGKSTPMARCMLLQTEFRLVGFVPGSVA